jgi:hypothetical protein
MDGGQLSQTPSWLVPCRFGLDAARGGVSTLWTFARGAAAFGWGLGGGAGIDATAADTRVTFAGRASTAPGAWAGSSGGGAAHPATAVTVTATSADTDRLTDLSTAALRAPPGMLPRNPSSPEPSEMNTSS